MGCETVYVLVLVQGVDICVDEGEEKLEADNVLHGYNKRDYWAVAFRDIKKESREADMDCGIGLNMKDIYT